MLLQSEETETDRMVKQIIMNKLKDLKYERNFQKTCKFLNQNDKFNCEEYFEKIKGLYSKENGRKTVNTEKFNQTIEDILKKNAL